MNFTLLVISTLLSIVHGARYGLLRVGSAAPASDPAAVGTDSNQRSLFEEDFSLAFRQLFGYQQAGLCMSMMASPLSMSMAQSQLSMSLANLSLSLSFGAAGMPFGAQGEGIARPGSANTDNVVGTKTSSSASNSLGTGAVAAVAAVGAAAAVALVAFARNRQNTAVSSEASVGSFLEMS